MPVSTGAKLTVMVTTSPTAPPNTYSPRHIAVVWIEDQAGTFIKTIDRHAGVRRPSLVGWIAKAGQTDVDAVTSATIANHTAPLSLTWDLKDKTGTVVPDGIYTVRMETADENATTVAQNNEGMFTFVKGAAPQTQTGLSNGGFSAVSITFTP
jgi:hypothetical protein